MKQPWLLRCVLAAALAALFLIANRGAFEGYFSDDDLDNLSWATVAGTPGFLQDFVSLRFSENNTRATGALFYKFAGLAFGFEFGRYIPWLMGIHLLNCLLLGYLARRRGAPETGAWAAAIFWGFHAGWLEAWWKPMYVFDLLCGTFCLCTWLLFERRRTLWAIATFMLAYRAKEVAIFLPLAMAFDNWRGIWPFALLSLNFGIQALFANAGRNNDYTLRFSFASLAQTIPFYAKQALFHKWGALLLAPLLRFWRERMLLIGVAGTLCLLAPLLFLPARLFSVYWYVPMLPLCLGLAFVFARLPRWLLVSGLALWLLMSFLTLREKRKTELALAQENRAYVQQLITFYALRPFPLEVFLEGHPPGLRDYGIRGALRLASGQYAVEVFNPEQEAARLRAKNRDLYTLRWFRPTQTLSLVPHRWGESKLSELDLGQAASAWQLRNGWQERTGNFRWAGESATLGLLAPPNPQELRVQFNVGPQLLEKVKSASTALLLNGTEIGRATFTQPGTPEYRFPLRQPLTGDVEIELRSSPGLLVPGFAQKLGIGVLRIGIY